MNPFQNSSSGNGSVSTDREVLSQAEEDHDDMHHELTHQQHELGHYEGDFSDDDEGNDSDYHDADENFDNDVEIEVEIGSTEGNHHGTGDNGGAAAGGGQPIYISREQILQLLGSTGLGRLLASDFRDLGGRRAIYDNSDDSDDSDDDYDEESDPRAPKRKRPQGREAFEKVPSDEGRRLMNSGTFGTNFRCTDTVRKKRKLQHRLLWRELGVGSTGFQKNANNLMKQDLVPGSSADMVIHYDSRCYSGQFSDDGNFFFSCSQDFRVRMYDTSNPYDWKFYKSVLHNYGQWTITDASLSRDNRFLAYSSIQPYVCLASTDPADDSDPQLLDFSKMGPGNRSHGGFGIWSIRFSGDGSEIVAGTGNNSVYVYDIERQHSVLRIPGHDEDVNAVCYGDANSPHILYSGSDDTTLKVWDRRSMADGREAGVFIGHTEGLTYVDSKGDGRYVLSNAKDQTAKLWDLRKMIPREKAEKIDTFKYSMQFEYRSSSPFPIQRWRPNPHDCSLVTFRGHEVLQTLIRCHFSPDGSTDGRYVYSGSHDGHVWIWNLDGTERGKIDVLKATRGDRARAEGSRAYHMRYGGWDDERTCVRDASWHPSAPVIAATSWNNCGDSQGTCSVHTWNDGLEEDEGPPMGKRVNAKLMHEQRLYRDPAARISRYGGMGHWAGLFDEESDEGEEEGAGDSEGEEEEEDPPRGSEGEEEEEDPPRGSEGEEEEEEGDDPGEELEEGDEDRVLRWRFPFL